MNNLRAFRETKGISQFKMAVEIGSSLSMYEKAERGDVPASRGFMQKLKSRYPDANIDEIFFSGHSNNCAVHNSKQQIS
jgi:transcriptional regulator with XRE-family HTH domain